MTVGDLLEWIAAAALVCAAALWSGPVLALAVGALCLGYLAQVYSDKTLRKRRDQ
jgi:hypothetical protein